MTERHAKSTQAKGKRNKRKHLSVKLGINPNLCTDFNLSIVIQGKFIISLDFELFWGVRDKRTIDGYGENIARVHTIIPRMLQLYQKYRVSATFAVVGFLFADNKEELIRSLPDNKPNYEDQNLSPYGAYMQNKVKDTDQYHYALSLIKQIQEAEIHEIATHTFSHYYCLEPGQTTDTFRADIKAAKKIADKNRIELKSIVLPRNQYSDAYISACQEMGIESFRGNEHAWFYKSAAGEEEGLIKRGFRLVDAYMNLSGYNTYLPKFNEGNLLNLPASSFLRPFSKKLKFLEPLKLNRIKSAMTHAARKKEVFHIWWHPHNFGSNTEENFNTLEKILDHYAYLNEKYNFESATMRQLTDEIKRSDER